ncbi:DksA/TraR family C4-type zinc finger protein [uncultured Desulfosarcina sp.]|uniref:DksA/TraR family C4-type zinc finger protein n=1 Tax=uncultured Desulfosarcina sp. TaxID=218289 RepID=UPI0029C97698|nr:DksA/TraR family C4-type zinc finger protein [uncultured Desulfosarcina sp.]
MAGGWSRDGAVQDQIDASVEDAVKLARSRLPDGEGLSHCEECETAIPDARRRAIPGVRLCVSCQSALEKQQAPLTDFNRRGSKDSQLK